MEVDADALPPKHIQLYNRTSECNRLYEFLDNNLAHLQLSREFRHDLKLVSEELLANIINHAYDKDTEKTIDIDLTVDESGIHITFTDSGIEFNPLEYKDPVVLNELSEGGMGILLVKSLTDKQSYKRDNRHNVFTVTKNYNP